jgi:hypothetical protein
MSASGRIPVVVHMTETCTVAQLVSLVLSHSTKPLPPTPTSSSTNTFVAVSPTPPTRTLTSPTSPGSRRESPPPVGATLDLKEHEVACGHTTLCAANEEGFPDDDCPGMFLSHCLVQGEN